MTKLRNGIAIVGASLVPKKLVDLITKLTGEGYKGDTKAVVFEEKDTSDKFGNYFAEGRMAVIYLKKHIDTVLKRMKEDDSGAMEPNMALHASLWLAVATTTIHELLHNESHKACRDEGSEYTVTEEDEKVIEKETWATMADLAKEYDIEPPTLGEWGFLEEIGMAADMLKTMTTSEEECWKQQRAMMELKLIVSSDGDNVFLETLREYFFMAEKQPEDWPETVKPLVEETELNADEIVDEPTFKDPISSDNMLSTDQTGMEDAYNEPDEDQDFWETAFEDYQEPAKANPNNFNNSFQADGFAGPQAGFGGNGFNGFQNQQNNHYTGGGGNWGVQPQKTLPTPNLNPQEAYMAVHELLMRMYNRFFKDCQFRAGNDNPFAMPQAVYEPLFVGDIPHIQSILVSADMEDAQGEHKDIDIWNRPQQNLNGCISGLVFKKASSPLPAFRFYVNKDGIKSKRLFIAQNIHKMTQTGGLSENAIAARNGNAIAWLMNIDPGTQNGFIAKIINGNMEMANQRTRSMGQ